MDTTINEAFAKFSAELLKNTDGKYDSLIVPRKRPITRKEQPQGG